MKDGLTFNKIKLSLNNLSKSNYVDYYVKKILIKVNYLNLPKNYFKGDFLKQPDEIVFRSFSKQFKSRKKRPLQEEKVENLLKYLKSDNNHSKKHLQDV